MRCSWRSTASRSCTVVGGLLGEPLAAVLVLARGDDALALLEDLQPLLELQLQLVQDALALRLDALLDGLVLRPAERSAQAPARPGARGLVESILESAVMVVVCDGASLARGFLSTDVCGAREAGQLPREPGRSLAECAGRRIPRPVDLRVRGDDDDGRRSGEGGQDDAVAAAHAQRLAVGPVARATRKGATSDCPPARPSPRTRTSQPRPAPSGRASSASPRAAARTPRARRACRARHPAGCRRAARARPRRRSRGGRGSARRASARRSRDCAAAPT